MVPKRSFCDLLHYLNANIHEKVRIRYVTSHPRYFSDRVIHAVAHLDKVCECFHMPFQAGDNQVLKQMRRGYTFESYMKIIDKIRAEAPDASICGDVIVGFPGESEEAFQRTLDLMKQVKFDNLNTFAYSTRPNTEAALWDNQVPEEVKSERLQRVQKLAAEHGLERSKRYVGRTVEVLVEDANPRNPHQCIDGGIIVEAAARRGLLHIVLCSDLMSQQNLLLMTILLHPSWLLIICAKGSMCLRRWLSVVLSCRSIVQLLCRRAMNFRGRFWLIISLLLGYSDFPEWFCLLAVTLSSTISCRFTETSLRLISVFTSLLMRQLAFALVLTGAPNIFGDEFVCRIRAIMTFSWFATPSAHLRSSLLLLLRLWFVVGHIMR